MSGGRVPARRPNPAIEDAKRQGKAALGFVLGAFTDPDFFSKLGEGDDDEVLVGSAPSDGRPPCDTCQSKRVVGARGHEVACPLCSPATR